MPEKIIPLSVPNLGEAERKALESCITSGWVSTASPQVVEFESAMKTFLGAENTIALSSGSAGLFLAMKSMGLKRGDLVLIPSLTFIATANAAVHLGAMPVLVDVDPLTWQMDPILVEKFLSEECVFHNNILIHQNTALPVWGIVTVDTLGHPINAIQWKTLTEKFQLAWVDDAAAALGSFRNGMHAGIQADASVLSFNGNKILTTGGGGMIFTANKKLADLISHLANNGYAPNRNGEYLFDIHGHNLRMTGLSAVLGISQLERMNEFIKRKNEIHNYYLNEFTGINEICPFRNPDSESSKPNHWMFTITLNDPEKLKTFLKAQNIESGKMWVPLHRQSLFADSIYLTKEDQGEKIYEFSLHLPCSTNISDQELERVVHAVKKYFGK